MREAYTFATIFIIMFSNKELEIWSKYKINKKFDDLENNIRFCVSNHVTMKNQFQTMVEWSQQNGKNTKHDYGINTHLKFFSIQKVKIVWNFGKIDKDFYFYKKIQGCMSIMLVIIKSNIAGSNKNMVQKYEKCKKRAEKFAKDFRIPFMEIPTKCEYFHKRKIQKMFQIATKNFWFCHERANYTENSHNKRSKKSKVV